MKAYFLIFSFLLYGLFLHATQTTVTTSTFSNAYTASADGDTLLLSAGNYGSSITFPDNKTITLKAAEGADVIFSGTVSGSTSINDGGLIFDSLTINLSNNYLFNTDLGNVKIIAFRNSTIENIYRCLIRTNSTGYTIDEIEISNCIIKDCGDNGYNFIYPKHIVKKVVTKNSTLYNYTGGESLFYPNATDNTNVLEFVFENNTVYKWAKSSDRAFANVRSCYSSSSTYTFTNNIINEPGVDGVTPYIVNITGGIITANNNLVVDYGTYGGGTQSINDITLSDLGLSSIGFPDPDNGDFTILSTSPIATAGVDGTNLGDPRWITTLSEAVTLTTAVTPDSAGTISPVSAAFEKGDTATVTATYNYGYRFKEWEIDGKTVSTDNPYTFQINNDVTLTAVFDTVETFTLTVNTEGDGAKWGEVTLNPEPTNGVYETGELVTATITPNSVTSFLYWEDLSSESTRTIQMTSNKSITATFDWNPFIVAWTFDPTEPRTDRIGDYYSKTDNTGLMTLYNADGSTTNWGGSTKTFGGITYPCARRYTNYADMSNPRYFLAEFSGNGSDQVVYKNICIRSYIAADNECVNKIQKIQYATSESGPFIDLDSVDISSAYNSEWIEINDTLPELTEDQKTKIYIRWIGDTSSELIGSPSSSATEGFYLANVTVYADIEQENDSIAPTLLSSVPADGSSTASASGNIVLSFDEKVQAASDDGKITFNGIDLTPTFGSSTVTYSYSGLDYGTEYSFTIPAGLLEDLSGNTFEGTTLTFSTMDRPQPIARLYDAVIATDSTGDYTNLQDAVDAAPASRTIPWLIFIKNGSYQGNVVIPSTKPYIYLIGQDKEKVIVHEKMNSQSEPDSTSSYYANDVAAWPYSVNNPESSMYKKEGGSVVKANASDFYAENITFRNDWGVEAQNGPMALAMYTSNDRFAFYNCKFRSYQDTWQTSSSSTSDRLYAYDCWIEGAVDYFYGGGDAFVDECTLYNKRSGAIIVAPSHKSGTQWGYVFNSCLVDGNTAASDGKLKLGRPWKNEPIAVYLNTTMNILPAAIGWTDMGPAPKLFAEYNSMDSNGDAIDLSNRKTWYYDSDEGDTITGLEAVLTKEEAAQYTYDNVIGGSDDWNPKEYFEPVAQPQNLYLNTNNLKLAWDSVNYAICYIVFKDSVVVGFTKSPEFTLETIDSNSEYYVRAANEYGSLGEMSIAATVSSGIENTTATNQNPIVEKNASELIVSNLEIGSTLTLYSIEGKLITRETANSNVEYIKTYALHGIYLLKIGKFVQKIVF